MQTQHIRTLLAGLVLSISASVLIGCDAGDTNPVTPDKMEAIRQRDGNARANFRPKGGEAPTSATAGKTTG